MSDQLSVFVKDLTFAWPNGPTILAVPEFKIARGEKVFLQGASGSGKSTFLGLIAGVFGAGSGELNVLGRSLRTLGASKRDALRAGGIGVIFQQFNLVPYLSLVENVLLPCRFSAARAARIGSTGALRRKAALELLDRLGLSAEAREGRAASALSVGQQQRVAAARALIGAPSLIIADEPTSALDAASRDAFIKTLLQEGRDASALFVSHDASLAAPFDRSETMAGVNAAIAPSGREA
ncbi:MAG: ATP-binding cassette domain-containing protein [Parvularculaceae bacterium]